MVIISTIDYFQMQVHSRAVGDCIKEFPNHLCVKRTDFLCRKLC